MERLLSCEFNMDTACVERPGVKFCVSVFRQKSRMALGSRADFGLNPLVTERQVHPMYHRNMVK